MRARIRFSVIVAVVSSVIGGLAWRTLGLRADTLAADRTAIHPRQAAAHRARLFNLCTAGFESISPCGVNVGTLTVGTTDSTMFQVQNNSSFDDIMVSTCTKPSVISSCSVRPVQDTVKAGRSKNIWLFFAAGTTRGTGVVTITASGNVDLQATDTVTVQPVQVLPKDTITVVPETTYTQSFTVKNLSATADTVNLTKGCPAAFTCSLLTTTPMVIAALSSGTANVSVTTGPAGSGGPVTLNAALTHGVGSDLGSVTTNVPVPLSPTVSALPHNGYNRNTALCAASCFNVTAGYSTPAYTSLDVPRSVSLVYSSAMAYPLALVSVNVKDSSFRLAQQLSISAVRGGVNETFTNGTTELYVSQSSTDTSTKRLAAQISTVLATGIYHDTTIIKSRWTSGVYAGTVTQTNVPTTLLIDNEQSSPYGAGWGIAGLQHLIFTSDSLSLALTDGTGSILLFTRPTKTSPWVSPLGDFTTLTTILSGGTVTSYHRVTPNGTILTFSPTGYLLGAKNRFGDSTQYHYNGSNLLTAIVDPIGDSLTLAYTSSKLNTITDPGGRVSHFTVDASGNLTTIRDPTNTTSFSGTYDTHHRLTQVTDRGSNTWLYRYDFASTIASDSTPAVLADGVTKRLGTRFRSTLAAELIDTASHTGSSTTPATRVIVDSVWALVSPPNVDSVRYRVDAFGNPLVTGDVGAQQITTVTLDSASRAIATIATSHGKVVQLSTAVWSGPVTTQTTDELSGARLSYAYDGTNELLTAVTGNTVPDSLFLNAAKTWADSERVGATGHDSVTKFTHDAHGRLTQTTDPSGHVTAVAYNTTGFQNTSTVTAVNRVTTYRYDRYGRADSTTIPGGAVFTVSLDSLNRTRSSRGPNGVHVTYAFDSLSHVRSITDAKGQTYQYSYNPLGWLITQINADTNHTLSARTDSFFYSAAGMVTKHRDRNAVSTTMTYDSLGRVLTLTLADGRVTKYTYDPNGYFQTDSSAASRDTVKIDTAGLVQTEFTKAAGQSYTITSTADVNGLLRRIVLKASGTTTWDSVGYGYDSLMRLDTIGTAGPDRTFLYYAQDGLLTSWKLPSGDSIMMSYSKTHRPLTKIYHRSTLNTQLFESLQRDTLDRVVQQTISALSDTVRFFGYDSTGRLTAYSDSLPADSLVCVPDPNGQDGEHCTPVGGWTFAAQTNYAYDSANNRTDLGAVLTPGNRTTTFNGYTLTYDNAGNLSHKSKTGFDRHYYWNSIGQLDSVVTNGTAVHFLYDGQGRRVRKRTSTQTLLYLYSGRQLVAEVDSATFHPLKLYRYYPGVDTPHSVKEPLVTYYYLSGIGTPGIVGLIDSTGKLWNRYRYTPWGALEDSLEQVPNVLKYAGREYDPETNLYYNRARYYDPQLARFLSEDPIGQGGGINQYAYAGNNPIGAMDPSGTCGLDAGGSYANMEDGDGYGMCSPRTDCGGDQCFGRGPVRIGGGVPDMGYSPCQGDIFDDFTGEDITADAALLEKAQEAGQDVTAIMQDLLSGDSSILDELDSMDADGLIFLPGNWHFQNCLKTPGSFNWAGTMLYGFPDGWGIAFDVNYRFTNIRRTDSGAANGSSKGEYKFTMIRKDPNHPLLPDRAMATSFQPVNCATGAGSFSYTIVWPDET